MTHYQNAIEKVLHIKSEVVKLPYDDILYIKRDQRKKIEELRKQINKQFSGLRFHIKLHMGDWYLLIWYRSGPLRIFRDMFIENLFLDRLNDPEGATNESKKRGQQ